MTPAPNFDEIINRHGTHSVKWDMMEKLYGVSAAEGIAMWVADMEFRPPHCVQQAVEGMAAHGLYGYYGDDRDYLEAIRWWMAHRHGWDVPAEAIFTTHGLVNGTALCVDSFTAPGDGVVLMTPVYHAFARLIRAAGREVVECPLKIEAGRHVFDTTDWEARITPRTKMFVLCSPHNPGGRIWSVTELQAIAAFCEKHDLILVSDEIHHDLVYPGHKHTVMPLAAPAIVDRLVVMSAPTKTFNIAGSHSGNVIVLNPELRARFAARMNAMGISANSFGLFMATAAYSVEGAAWVDALMAYLDGNRRLFDEGVNAIPGLASMNLQATYLAWVDFSDTGMAPTEFIDRVEKGAKIAANHGASFGLGGDNFLRFNLAAPRAQVAEAVARLQSAFADLQ